MKTMNKRAIFAAAACAGDGRAEDDRAFSCASQKQTGAPRQISHYITSNFHPFLHFRSVRSA